MLSLQEGMVRFFFFEAIFFFLRYCGEKCQKADWETHWQWCQQKVEARSKKEEKKGEVKETNRGKPIEEKCRVSHGRESEEGLSRGCEPFPLNSLAFELD